MKLDVGAYLPNPLRCYNCQHRGHGKATCNRKAVCAKCSQEGHQDAECENPPHCANCAGNHIAYSRDCPECAKQKEIAHIKFDENISFGNAKQFVGQRIQTNTSLSSGNVSYATVTALVNKQASAKTSQMNKQTQSIKIQTGLTLPINSDIPFLHLSSKSNVAVRTDTSIHLISGLASGGLAAPSPSTAALSVAGAAAGGVPPQIGDKPRSKSSAPTPSSSTTASHLKEVSQVASGKKSETGPASSKGPDKPPIKPNIRPPKGSGDLVKLSN